MIERTKSSNGRIVSDSDILSIHLSSSPSGIEHVEAVRGGAMREGSYL